MAFGRRQRGEARASRIAAAEIVASLICGIVGIATSIIFALVGVAVGIVAIVLGVRARPRPNSRGLATGGIATGAVAVVLGLINSIFGFLLFSGRL
jgi:tetrahydromethanopterin S-methyltransferase subunit C